MTKYARLIEEARAAGTMHPAETWSDKLIRQVIEEAGFVLRSHGAQEYCVCSDQNLPREVREEQRETMRKLFNGISWRSGELRYGYHQSIPPSGWFYTPQHALHKWLLEHEIVPDGKADS